MKTWEIWAEGYLATGMDGIPARASLMGRSKGETFLDACSQLFKANPKFDGTYYYDAKRNTYWGCRLFDNEADARKLFG